MIKGLSSKVSKKVRIAFKQLKSLGPIENKHELAELITEKLSDTQSEEILLALEALKI